ncbi:MAG: proton-conducting transporter transmembrane domain-containing protein [Planctomycetota bacterium]|jgi:multicomponent Na+:H+ antiporter subunit D
MSQAQLLVAMLVLPLAGALGVLLALRNPNLREAVTLVTGGLVLGVVGMLVAGFDAAAATTVVLARPLPGMEIALSPEPLGLLFALVAGFLWPVTSIYAIGYMRGHHEENQTRFFTFFAVSISATLGIAMSANLLTLFLFYELLTLATFPLVTHAGTPEAKRAGRVYLGLLMGTSVMFLLLAVVWTWQVAGTLDFADGGILPADADPTLLGILLLLFVFGAGKAAMMPFHRWLPAAMVAPTPVSSLLHAVAVVKAGVFTVLKVAVYVFGIERIGELASAEFLAYLAGFGILAASAVAMKKDNLKARLAYSTISQLGYITLGAMLGTASGVVGGSMHIATHAFGKITLFFCAGAILVAAHKKKVSELDGLGRRMPFTMAAFTIGSLSVIGLPPTGGTWSKWFLVQGTLDAGQWVLVGVLLASSLLNIAYLLVIPVRGFFRPPALAEGEALPLRAPFACRLAIGVTVAGTLFLFFLPGPLHWLALGVLP